MMKRLDEEVPPVFMILDTFDKDVKSLLPGTHLFCVYGDNWFQSVKYQLRCLVAVPTSADCVVSIQENESKLAEKKRHLENFQVNVLEFSRLTLNTIRYFKLKQRSADFLQCQQKHNFKANFFF